MTAARSLLNAKHIGIRELREHLSKRLKGNQLLIVTEHGTPTKVIVSYKDMLELVDVLEELQNSETLSVVREGRMAVKKGAKGIPVTDLFAQIRASRQAK